MKYKRIIKSVANGLLFATGTVWTVALAFGQQTVKAPDPSTFKRLVIVKSSNLTLGQNAVISPPPVTGPTVPYWSYSITSPLDGNTYTGNMVGRNPMFNGHRTTTIQAYIVPVKLTFTDGTVFDPSSYDGCIGNSVVNMINGSPVVTPIDWNLGGTDIGTETFDDAYQRANFWKYVAPFPNVVTPYHIALSYKVLSAVSVSVPAQNGYVYHDTCPYGIMDYNWWDNYVTDNTGAGTSLISQLASQGVGPTTLPIFVFDSVVMYLNGNSQNCCALGDHGAYTPNGTSSTQTYVVADYDSSSFWDPDISSLSDEIGKWMDDPFVTNPTPAFSWPTGNKVSSPCQNILEVGDPLTGYVIPTTMPNGNTYNPQELVFFSWFFDQVPSIAVNGWYSFDQTESGPNTKVCQGNVNSTNGVAVTGTHIAGALAP